MDHDHLRSGEDAMRLLVDNVPAMVISMSADGQVDWVNRRTLDYFDRPLEELRSWRTLDSVHPEDLSSTIAAVERGLAEGRAFEIEHRLRRADGVYRWYRHQLLPFRDADGRLIRWYGTLTDFDDLKRAHDALRASAGDLRLWIDSIPGLVYTMTPQGALELVNRQVLEYHGRTFEELRRWNEIGCVHPDDLPRVMEAWRRAVDFGEPNEPEQRLRRADGTYRWFKPSVLALRDSEKRIVRWYGLLTDIDDRKRAEERLRSIQARFSRAAHLASMSELAASIAHEINQPLAAIGAAAHACVRWLSSSPPHIECARLSAERTVRDSSAAADVVTRIRSLFKHAPAVKQLLNVNDVIEEVCRLMSEDLDGRAIALRTNLEADLPQASADRVQLQQLLANLVRNAAEAMDAVVERAREISILSRHDGAEITVYVTDCGVGLSAPEAAFDPFYTTKQSGMGMGLAICRTIIEAHEGRLWAFPHSPHGTTFAFALPARR